MCCNRPDTKRQYQRGVIGVTNLARRINPEIGNYIDHYNNEMFSISVKLSNGAMNLSVEIVQDFESNCDSIELEELKTVKSFRKK